MKLIKNYIRFFRRIVMALMVPDYMPKLPTAPRVIISCQDVDRYMKGEAGYYSPILEGISITLEECGYSAINFTHPYATLRSNKVKGGTLTLNYKKLFFTSCGMLLSLLRMRNAKQALIIGIYWRLIKKSKPIAIFAIEPPPELCVAAKKSGVPIFEPMHAKSISLSDSIVKEYFARPDELSPDVYITFDPISQNTLLELLRERKKFSVQFPDPWLSLIQRKRPVSTCATNVVEINLKKILVTLQWGYDGERSCFDNIIKNGIMASELETVLTSGAENGIVFYIRMHPIQLNGIGYDHHRRYIESLCRRYKHLEYQRASSEPLPLLLEEMCGHITMCSGSTSEAVAAGVPTLLLCPTLLEGGANYGLFRELESTGIITFGSLVPEFIQTWISSCQQIEENTRKNNVAAFNYENEKNLYRELIANPCSFAITKKRM